MIIGDRLYLFDLERGDVLRALTIHPENTAVVAGKPARFRCASNSSPSLTWIRIDVKTLKETTLVSGCGLNPALTNVYALENVGSGRCDLVVKKASAGDAGMYRCEETLGWDLKQSALLAVLGGFAQESLT